MFGIYCSVSDPSLVSYPIIFDALDGPVIRAAALHTSGTAGLSGVDAYGWRHLWTKILVFTLFGVGEVVRRIIAKAVRT